MTHNYQSRVFSIDPENCINDLILPHICLVFIFSILDKSCSKNLMRINDLGWI